MAAAVGAAAGVAVGAAAVIGVPAGALAGIPATVHAAIMAGAVAIAGGPLVRGTVAATDGAEAAGAGSLRPGRSLDGRSEKTAQIAVFFVSRERF